MPIYEYQCSACGHQLEALQKITDEPLKECPECHQEALNKLVSAAGFQLKGTGWYVTDYRDKNKPKQANPVNGESAKGDGTQSKTESKNEGSSGNNSSGADTKGGTQSNNSASG